MSKSYWMKEQEGDFSNEKEDTFDPEKRYVGIRLQQGVPLLDRDWNELEDIRRYEEWKLRRWYVGNGTPDDGFKISAVGPPAKNDFKIKAGRCIVDGFEAVNDKDILYLQQKGVKKPLSSGTDRVDTVYLDVWIEEVTSAEDPALKNSQDVDIETCVRHKLEWRVRVDEGSKGYDAEKDRHYYDIAKITREAGRDTILNTDIEDLRRTGLGRDIAIGDNKHRAGKIRLWQEPNSEDDHVSHAIGTEAYHNIYGAGKEYANSIGHKFYRGGGELIAQIGFGGSGKPANRLDSYFAGNVGIGTAAPGIYKLNIAGTNGQNALFLASDFGLRDDNKLNIIKFGNDGDYQILHKAKGAFERNTLAMHVNANDAFGVYSTGWRPLLEVNGGSGDMYVRGKVGIGTTEPGGRLEVKSTWGDWIFLRQQRKTEGGGGFHIHNPWKDTGGADSNRLEIGYRTSAGQDKWGQFVIHGPTGNVGIGTTDPGDDKLDVRGRCYSSGGWLTTNADYAEYFESVDGSEIPVGTSVTLTNDAKIGHVKKGDVPIGIITTNSAIVGNSYKEWPKKYLRDEFGNQIMEEYKEEVMIPKKEKIKKERKKVEKKTITEEVTRTEIVLEKGKYIQKEISESIAREIEEPLFEEVDVYDATGKKVIGKHKVPVMETYEKEIDVLDENGEPVLVGSGEFVTKERPKLNPEYDESQEYVSREQRQEWNCVGLLGQLPLCKGQPVAPTWIKVKDISKKVELWLVR